MIMCQSDEHVDEAAAHVDDYTGEHASMQMNMLMMIILMSRLLSMLFTSTLMSRLVCMLTMGICGA